MQRNLYKSEAYPPSMPFLDKIKGTFAGSSQKLRDEELVSYLMGARDNLKLASEQLVQFLQSTREFEPAKRHQQVYHDDVKAKLVKMRSGMKISLAFLDERMNNVINTLGPVKNPEHLKDKIGEWISLLRSDDEKAKTVLQVLEVEMWSDARAKRGFPRPSNKDILCRHLHNVHSYLWEARNQLDHYVTMSGAPSA